MRLGTNIVSSPDHRLYGDETRKAHVSFVRIDLEYESDLDI